MSEEVNNQKKERMTEEQKEFFMQRYDFIYKELNRIQDNMSQMEIQTTKLLTELQNLREKERQHEE